MLFLVLTVLFSSLLLTSGQGFDELDTYGGDEPDTSSEDEVSKKQKIDKLEVLECLKDIHKEYWHVRWSEELAKNVQKNILRMAHVSYYKKNWDKTFYGLDAVIYQLHGTNHDTSAYLCDDFRELKYEQIKQISVRDGAAETGCGIKVRGKTVTVVCLYRVGIKGYNPVIYWNKLSQ